MTAPATPPAAPTAQPPVNVTLNQPSTAERVNKRVEQAINRNGSAEAALSVYMAQVVGLEDQAVTLTRERDEARGQVPDPNKMVVLPKERAELLNKFESLKLTPEQITEALKERDTAKGSLSERDREAMLRRNAAGYDPDALVAHVRAANLHAEERDVTVLENGKQVQKKALYVRPATDDKAPLALFGEYAAKLPAYDQRALKPGTVPATPAATQAPAAQYPVIGPTPSAGESGDDYVASFLKQRNDRASKQPNAIDKARGTVPTTPATTQ